MFRALNYIWSKTTGQPLPTGTYANVATRPYDQQVYGSMVEYENIGWSNDQSFKVELQHGYSKGYSYQIFYVMSNALRAGGTRWYGNYLETPNQYLPGTVPSDPTARLRLTDYQRDNTIPKHSVKWNWLVDLPVGKGKFLGRNMNGVLDRIIGGWQIAGSGSLNSSYYGFPSSNWGPVGNVQVYGKKYPIQDCTSGVCYSGYLWWNGYISPSVFIKTDSSGHCIGICSVR